MAAGVKNGKQALTAAAALGTFTDGVTFSFLSARCIAGSVAVGNSGVTQANGFQVPRDSPLVIPVTITAADLFFIGVGTLEFVGIATA